MTTEQPVLDLMRAMMDMFDDMAKVAEHSADMKEGYRLQPDTAKSLEEPIR